MNLNISFQMTSTIDAKSNSGNVEYKKIQFCFEKEASVWILKFQIELILFFEKNRNVENLWPSIISHLNFKNIKWK